MNSSQVAIIMGSDSDLEVMSEAAKVLEEFGVSYEMTVASAHRAPNLVHEHVSRWNTAGVKVIIAGAGGAFHLAGVVASLSPLPVVAVPIKTKALNGLDSLLATVNMPPGVPVAVVGINAAKNAGLLAVEIVATSDENLRTKLLAYKIKLESDNKSKGEKLSKHGYKKYLGNSQ
ncbi:MAG: 5-(carboxyamino)imidazole ribonucleotide mutase [Candidatus Doudnabacteria bacterium]|nr:5-(carboxyamino)imidazole ribonucleotide mutase [Candidatus Doudnabacteria bacterium]